MSMTTRQIDELRNIADAMKYVKANRISKVLRDAAETISLLSANVAAQNMERSTAYYNGGWIPTYELSPSEDGYYVICDETGFRAIIKYLGGNWITQGVTPYDVKAWMSLPKPYEEEKHNEN